MYANCRGIIGQKVSIKEIVEETDTDIIVLTDTWYKNNKKKNLRPINYTQAIEKTKKEA